MASNTTSQFPILNPSTPLAFLTPEDGAQFEAAAYLYVATLAAFIWDWLCTTGDDYRLLTQYTLNLPTIVYFISRVAALSYILTSAIFQVSTSVGSCQGLQVALGACWAVATPATSLLFFFRIRAVFDRERIVVGIFALLWLATLGGSLAVPFATGGGRIGPTQRCINTYVRPFASVGLIINTCNDTLVFIAISWRLIQRTAVKGKVNSFFRGRNLPGISRELLQGGQLYYLITVGGNILTIAMILSPSIHGLLHGMFTIPNMALENSMACRVFRNIKLSRPSSTHVSAMDATTGVSRSHPGNFALHTFGGTALRPAPGPVQITKMVEHFDDREIDSVHRPSPMYDHDKPRAMDDHELVYSKHQDMDV